MRGKNTYITWGNGKKQHGKVTAIAPGGRGGDDWSKAKLTIEVAEKGAGSEAIVVTETVLQGRGVRLVPRNSNKSWLDARRKSNKNGNGKSAPKKKATRKKAGLKAAAGPPPGGSSVQAAKARFAALGL
jgi:hypothetical protein